MRKMKRLICLLLSVIMTLSVFSALPQKAEAAIDYDTYKARYQAFISDSRWKNGIWWGDSQTPKTASWSSSGCFAYTADFVYEVFGVEINTLSDLHYDASQIQAGDIVRINNWHSFVVLERNGSKLYTAEGNTTVSGSPRVYITDSKYSVNGSILYSAYDGNCAITWIRRAGVNFHTHSYTSSITKAATCTATGVRTFSCSCGNSSYTEVIPAKGHTAVTDPAVAATCTETGLTAGSHCSVCGATITAQNTIPAKGHDFGNWSTVKEATYTETGLKQRECKVCSFVETETIPMLVYGEPIYSEWSEDYPDGVDESLIETKKQYKKSTKETTTSDKSSLDGWMPNGRERTGLSTKIGPVYSDPSNGEREVTSESYIVSENTKKVWHYSRSISGAKGWNDYNVSISPNTALLKYSQNITLDDKDKLTKKYDNWNNLGPLYGQHIHENFDCPYWFNEWSENVHVSYNYGTRWYYQEPIYTYYYFRWTDFSDWQDDVITENDNTRVETRTVYRYLTNPHEHTPAEAVSENVVQPTCTTAGSYDSVIYCSECNEEISRETITVPALGHDFGEWTVVKAPTVSEAGLRQRVCSRDSAHIETEEIEKLPDPDAPALTVDNITAKPGETVTVSVSIKNNPGIAGMVITPFYDTENLTLTKVTKGNLGFAISSSKNITFDTNGDNETGNGTLVKLTFVVSDSAEAGQYDISVIVREAVNADWQNISLLAEKGSITVEEEKQVITGTCGPKATWTLSGGTLTLSGTGAMTNFANKTAMPWYEYLDQIEKVVIEDGITSIGNYAFMGCSDLAEVNIGSAVKTIGVNAFSGCSKIEEVSLPASLTGISNYAFNNCSCLSLIEFNSAAAPTLGANALANTKATAIYKSSWSGFGKDKFGGKPTWLVDHAGGSCGATKYSLDRGVMTISGKGTIRGYSNGEAPWYPLRDEILTLNIGDEVTSVGNFAFIGCSNLAELNLGRSVTAINTSSFNGCSSLEKVELPEGLTTLGSYAFTNCSGLSEITFNGNTAPTIAGTAFNTVKAKAVHAGNDSWSAFNKAGFGGAIYWTDDPEEEVIGGNCGNQAAWILVDGTLTIYGQNGTKGYAKKTDVPWHEYRDQITKIVVEDGITSLGNYSFMECENVTEVQLGNTLRFIGVNAFSTLKSLKTITIPASVTTINGYAFNKCSSLEKVNFEGEKPSVLASNAFNNTKVKL